MPTQTSGTISLSNIGQSWGSGYTGIPTSHAINNYYRGGLYIPSIPFGNNQSAQPAGPTTLVSTAGSNMAFNNYYNIWQYKRLSFNMTATNGTYSSGKYIFSYYGYSAAQGQTATTNPWNFNGTAYGSITASSFVSPRGTMTITGLHKDTQVFLGPTIVLSASTQPTDDDYSFIAIYNGFKAALLSRSARTTTGAAGLSRNWNYGAALDWPTSGTYACYVNYYG